MSTALFGDTLLEAPITDSRATEGLKVSSELGFWIGPGESTGLTAYAKDPQAQIAWKAESKDGSWRNFGTGASTEFTAPSSSRKSCISAAQKIRAFAKSQIGTIRLEFLIRIQNPICSLTKKDGLIDNSTTKIAIGKDESILVGTRNGLTQFRASDLRPLRHSSAGDKRPLKIITAIEMKDNGEIWVGNAVTRYWIYGPVVWGKGIERLNPDKAIPWKKDVLLANSFVSSISFPKSQSRSPLVLAVRNYTLPTDLGDKGGLYLGNLTENLLPGLNFYESLSMGPDLLLLGGNDGLRLVDNNQVVAHFNGKEWNGGGYFFGLGSNRSVLSLAIDKDGTVWAGLRSGVVSDGGLLEIPYFDEVISAKEKERSTGTRSKPFKWRVVNIPEPAGNDIRDLVVDDNNNLWIGTNRGLVTRDSSGLFSTLATQDGLAGDRVSDLFYDQNTQFLWIATNAGVTRLSLPQLGPRILSQTRRVVWQKLPDQSHRYIGALSIIR